MTFLFSKSDDFCVIYCRTKRSLEMFVEYVIVNMYSCLYCNFSNTLHYFFLIFRCLCIPVSSCVHTTYFFLFILLLNFILSAKNSLKYKFV